MTIREAFETRANNFDLLRLVAVLLVLWSHSYTLTGTGAELFHWLTDGYDTGGGMGVAIFFAISGFLVARSVTVHASGQYLLNRVLRIVPALALVTVFDIFCLGPMVTSLGLADYLLHPETLQHARNIFVFGVSFNLPGVFTNLPHTGVNGSIWTLALECGFYLLLPVAMVCGLLSRRGVLLLVAAVAGLVLWGSQVWGLSWGNMGGELWAGASLFPVLRYGLVFVLGAALWVHRATVPVSAGLALACLILLYAFANRPGAQFVYLLALPYLVIYAALAHPLSFDVKERFGDMSYGAYLFAFPLQQLLIWAFGPEVGPTAISLMATPLALAAGFVSWHLVERPALDLRYRRGAAAGLARRPAPTV
ncbi:peptidoglycan/LPS O-acetylase OafA/YrhL [Chelatococcus caeni]|uniref:Peptidoglycan/LPS O-acetylase OafA/YrhL n=1 Tax=Chelatococcus caeni TaxID=1348468 RepID=A0A840BUY8_9HYPH|nr:acyltransferase [Chelatococcus caeni]MBB4016774.1 peptidoglycan/LPS O-acetylase OafA/YrhL [Chelatococcus caeni]